MTARRQVGWLLLLTVSVGWGGTLEVARLPDDRPVRALVTFAGKLFPEPALDKPVVILSYVPDSLDLQPEVAPAGRATGAWQRQGETLYLPAAGGYFHSAGDGDWAFEAAPLAVVRDVVEYDGRLFLAGHGEEGEGALVAWREGDAAWTLEPINAQAARLAPEASRFLATDAQLSVLAPRDPLDEWPRYADPAWGAWYVLHYYRERSVRGFLFDGQARPLPVLAALAPGSGLLLNSGCTIVRPTPWADGLLYLTRLGDLVESEGALFMGTVATGNPQVGRSLVARRVSGPRQVRDVCVDGATCYVLEAANSRPGVSIRTSRDLQHWETLFEGELSAPALSMGVIDGDLYLGLDDGAILQVTP